MICSSSIADVYHGQLPMGNTIHSPIHSSEFEVNLAAALGTLDLDGQTETQN